MGLREDIIDFCQRDHVSFVELKKNFPEMFDGEHAICFPDYSNLIVWQGLSQDGAELILSLVNERKLFLLPSNPLVYAIDGALVNMPMAKRILNYKNPHWIPMVLCIHPPEFYQKQKKKKGIKTV